MWRFSLPLAALLLLPLAAGAQAPGVVRDGSLGPAGEVPLEDGTYLIRGDYGRQVGSNLFHSFTRFSVGGGEVATFTADGLANPERLTDVIGRVTGEPDLHRGRERLRREHRDQRRGHPRRR